jgi:hypothetical protein
MKRHAPVCQLADQTTKKRRRGELRTALVTRALHKKRPWLKRIDDIKAEVTVGVEYTVRHRKLRADCQSCIGSPFDDEKLNLGRRLVVDAIIRECHRSEGDVGFDNVDVVLFPAMIYYDRVVKEVIHAHHTDSHNDAHCAVSALTPRQRGIMCFYAALKCSAEIMRKSAPSPKEITNRCELPRGRSSFGFEVSLYAVLGWDMETRANASQLTDVLLCLSGQPVYESASATEQFPMYLLAMRLCLLSAYDHRLSPAWTSPLGIASACVALALHTGGLPPWPRELRSHFGDPGVTQADFADYLRIISGMWTDLGQPGAATRWKGCPWAIDYLSWSNRVPLRADQESLGWIAKACYE